MLLALSIPPHQAHFSWGLCFWLCASHLIKLISLGVCAPGSVHPTSSGSFLSGFMVLACVEHQDATQGMCSFHGCGKGELGAKPLSLPCAASLSLPGTLERLRIKSELLLL